MLKRGAADFLAGRAILRKLFPLPSRETDFSNPARQLLRYGSMPMSITVANDEAREEFLRAYVTMYLSEEIKAGSLVRDLGNFSRFLSVASLVAGQTTNLSGIARDATISRETARGYFESLVDTEAKHGRHYRREHKKGIDAFLAGRTARSYIVYGGTQELDADGTRVLPLEMFLRRLHAGEIGG